MATFTKFDSFTKALAEKQHDLSVDVIKVMLTNTAPIAANSFKSDLIDLTAGNGYTAGGNTAALSTSSQTAGVYCLVLSDPATWTAVTAAMGPFRYAVVYNSTPALDTAKGLIGWFDYGSALTLQVAETFRVDLSQVAGTGLLTIT